MKKLEFKTLSYAAPARWLNTLVAQLREADYDVIRDNDAGTVIAKSGNVEVMRAMRSSGGRWLVRGAVSVFTPVSGQ